MRFTLEVTRRYGIAVPGLFSGDVRGADGVPRRQSGRGDGPASDHFARPAMNLRKGLFWYTGQGLTEQQEHAALSRIVRFGVYGTSMPGHEALSDEQVADVAAYVQELTRDDHVTGTLAGKP